MKRCLISFAMTVILTTSAHARGGSCGSSGFCGGIGFVVFLLLIGAGLLSLWIKYSMYAEHFPMRSNGMSRRATLRDLVSETALSPEATLYLNRIIRGNGDVSELAAAFCREYSLDLTKINSRGYSNDEIVFKLGCVKAESMKLSSLKRFS